MRNINRKLCVELIIIFNFYVNTTQADNRVLFSNDNDDDDIEQSVHDRLLRSIDFQQRFVQSVTDTTLLITEGSGEDTVTSLALTSSISSSASESTTLATDLTTEYTSVTLASTAIALTSGVISLSTIEELIGSTATSDYVFSLGSAATDNTIVILTSTSTPYEPSSYTIITTNLDISIENTTTATTTTAQITSIQTFSTDAVPSTITSTIIDMSHFNSTHMSTNTTVTTSSSTSAKSTTTTSSEPNCGNSTHTIYEGTCTSKETIQRITSNILRENSTNATVVANALSEYIGAITNSNISSNSNSTLSLAEINTSLDIVIGGNITENKNSSFIMIQPTKTSNESVFILGASVIEGVGGRTVDTSNQNERINTPNLLTAAIVDNRTLNHVTSLKILIINDPTAFANADNFTKKTIASSLVVFSLQRINNSDTTTNVSLYFTLFDKSTPSDDRDYRCSYYNISTSRWDEYGCSPPRYNQEFKRFECYCNHTTTFALIWLPKSHTRYLDAQDITSLVFQCISILCFIIVISHGLGSRLSNPFASIQAHVLLPLLSAASTTLLFIFFIALTLTVYTKTPSTNTQECFLSSIVLMFITYFLLIFMFCVKTSVGYFNYLQFVYLFPQPSHRKLCLLLLISFLISLICVALAIGFNYNSSSHITKLYPYRLCWFTHDVIYYFMTIPACIFLLMNVIIMVVVGSRIIAHVRHAASPHQSYERMKRCVVVLLSSCITQGIGWAFGPSISFVNERAGNVLGWLFIIFNVLEGFWTIVLYIIIRLQHMDEQKRIIAQKYLTKSTKISLVQKTKKRIMYPEQTLSRQLRSPIIQFRKEPKGFKDFDYRKRTNNGLSSGC